MWILNILVCISVSCVTSWVLPPKEFLSHFATEHDRTFIIIYLPQKMPLKWIKNYFISGSNITPASFIIPSLVANFSGVLTANEDLHVFVPDDKDKKSMEISIQLFMEIYGLRSNSRREHWLLDISYWTDSQEASKDLSKLPTDLDDDLYWYKYLENASASLHWTQGNQSDIELFEIYKISEDMNMTVNYYGHWSKAGGKMKLVKENKWSRRKNLKVDHNQHAN